MKIFKTFVFLLFIFLLNFSRYGFSAASGNYGINSLDLNASGARQFGMGETGVGLAEDVNTITINPAGLNLLTSPEVSFMYFINYEDTSYISGNGAFPLPSVYGVVGASFVGFSSKSITASFDEGGNSISDLNYSDSAIAISYANNPLQFFDINQNLSLGVNVKFGSSTIASTSKDFIAFDIGALYGLKFANLWDKTKEDNFSIGASVLNLGPAITYSDDATKLPGKERFGIGWETYLSKQMDLNFAADYIIAAESENSLNLGGEVVILKMFSVRVGYQISSRTTDSFTVGAGVKTMISQYELSANYAFVPAGDLGNTHAISLGFKF